MRRGSFGIVALLLLAATGRAEELRVGKVAAEAPEGWRKRVQGDATFYLDPNDDRRQAFGLAVLPGRAIAGDTRTAFEKAIRERIGAGERIERERETRQARAGDPDIWTREIEVSQEKGPTLYRLYIGIRAGDRLEMLAFVTSDPRGLERRRDRIDATLRSVHLLEVEATRTQSRPSRPEERRSAAVAGFEGLYVASVLTNQFVPSFGGLGGGSYLVRARNECWLLLPGGRVYFGLPDREPGAFDFEKARAADPARCGIYTLDGGRIRFAYRGQEVTFPRGAAVVTLGRIASGQVGGQTFFKRVAAETGLRLEGTFVNNRGAGFSSATGSQSVAGSTAFTFTRDGRFTADRFTGFVAEGDRAEATGRESGGAQGTYRIRDYLLELTFAGGKQARLFFFRFPGEEDRAIVLEGASYLRRRP